MSKINLIVALIGISFLFFIPLVSAEFVVTDKDDIAEFVVHNISNLELQIKTLLQDVGLFAQLEKNSVDPLEQVGITWFFEVDCPTGKTPDKLHFEVNKVGTGEQWFADEVGVSVSCFTSAEVLGTIQAPDTAGQWSIQGRIQCQSTSCSNWDSALLTVLGSQEQCTSNNCPSGSVWNSANAACCTGWTACSSSGLKSRTCYNIDCESYPVSQMCTPPSEPTQLTISGVVINDVSDDLLSGVAISWEGIQSTTNSEGAFTLSSSESGSGDLCATKSGFHTNCFPVTANLGDNLIFTIQLPPKDGVILGCTNPPGQEGDFRKHSCSDGSEINKYVCLSGEWQLTGQECGVTPSIDCTNPNGVEGEAITQSCPDGTTINVATCIAGSWLNTNQRCEQPPVCDESTCSWSEWSACEDGVKTRVQTCDDVNCEELTETDTCEGPGLTSPTLVILGFIGLFALLMFRGRRYGF